MEKLFVSSLMFFFIFGSAQCCWAQVPMDVVAFDGEIAPGTNQRLTLESEPSIDNNGQITFAGNVNDSRGFWAGTAGNIVPFALAGIVPTSGGEPFTGIISQNPDLEEAGPNAYQAVTATSGGGTLNGTWIRFNGIDQRIVDSTIPVPGIAPGTGNFSLPPTVAANPAGQYAFWDELSTDSNQHGGIWANIDGALQLIVRDGTQAPNMPVSVTFDRTFSRPEISGTGMVTFAATLSNNAFGLFESDGNTITTIALQGQSVPGVSGATFGQPANQQLHPNSHGDIAFWDGSIWLKNSSGYHRIAQAGSAIIGGGVLSGLDSNPHVSDDGRVFFLGNQTDGNSGLYYSDSAGIHLIARTGMQMPNGKTLSRIYSPQVSDDGQVAFLADVQSASGGLSALNYLFATDQNGNLKFVAGPGTQVSLPSSTFTAAAGAFIYSRMFTDVELSQFSDNGDLTFSLSSNNGGGPRVFMVAHLPEPSSAIALAIISIALICRRPCKSL